MLVRKRAQALGMLPRSHLEWGTEAPVDTATAEAEQKPARALRKRKTKPTMDISSSGAISSGSSDGERKRHVVDESDVDAVGRRSVQPQRGVLLQRRQRRRQTNPVAGVDTLSPVQCARQEAVMSGRSGGRFRQATLHFSLAVGLTFLRRWFY